MSTIEIRFVTETTGKIYGIPYPDLVAMGIRDFTWSQYSHVEFVMDKDWTHQIAEDLAVGTPNVAALRKGVFSLGASDLGTLGARHADGVAIRPTNYEPFSLDDRFVVETTPERKAVIIQFALAQVGKSYDLTALLGILAHRDWREDDSWFCSELVAAAFEAGDEPLLNPHAKLNRITPEQNYLSPKLTPKALYKAA